MRSSLDPSKADVRLVKALTECRHRAGRILRPCDPGNICGGIPLYLLADWGSVVGTWVCTNSTARTHGVSWAVIGQKTRLQNVALDGTCWTFRALPHLLRVLEGSKTKGFMNNMNGGFETEMNQMHC